MNGPLNDESGVVFDTDRYLKDNTDNAFAVDRYLKDDTDDGFATDKLSSGDNMAKRSYLPTLLQAARSDFHLKKVYIFTRAFLIVRYYINSIKIRIIRNDDKIF